MSVRDCESVHRTRWFVWGGWCRQTPRARERVIEREEVPVEAAFEEAEASQLLDDAFRVLAATIAARALE